MHHSKQIKSNAVGIAILFFSLFLNIATLQATTTIKSHAIDANNQELTITVALQPHDFVYKEFIDFSVDSPAVTLSGWQTTTPTTEYFDPIAQEKKKVFENNLTIKLTATRQQPNIDNASLHFSYFLHSKKGINEEIFPLSFTDIK